MSQIFDFTQNDLYRKALEKGCDFVETLIIKNNDRTLKDISGWSASMAVKASIDDTEKIFDLSSSSGGIAIDTEKSTITITIASTDTAEAPAGVWVYDLETAVDGRITKLLTGKFEIVESVI